MPDEASSANSSQAIGKQTNNKQSCLFIKSHRSKMLNCVIIYKLQIYKFKYNDSKFYQKVLIPLKLELVTAAHFTKNKLAKRFVLAAGALYVLWRLCKVTKFVVGADWEFNTEQLNFYFLANGFKEPKTKKAVFLTNLPVET